MSNKIRLLIVDENTTVRQALATRLSTSPELDVLPDVDSLPNVERLVIQSAPDVVLIEPKRMNGEGYQLIERLTAVPDPPLIIILTSFHDEDEELFVNELGISLYMLKEIDSQALVNVILDHHDPGRGLPAH